MGKTQKQPSAPGKTLWSNPKVITVQHPSQDERKELERKLKSLPDTPEGEAIRTAARLRFSLRWFEKSMCSGFLNQAKKEGTKLDEILKTLLP